MGGIVGSTTSSRRLVAPFPHWRSFSFAIEALSWRFQIRFLGDQIYQICVYGVFRWTTFPSHRHPDFYIIRDVSHGPLSGTLHLFQPISRNVPCRQFARHALPAQTRSSIQSPQLPVAAFNSKGSCPPRKINKICYKGSSVFLYALVAGISALSLCEGYVEFRSAIESPTVHLPRFIDEIGKQYQTISRSSTNF